MTTKEDKLFDKKYYELVWYPTYATINKEQIDEMIPLWKKAVPFLRENFDQVKGGANRPHIYEIDEGEIHYSVRGIDIIHFFIKHIVSVVVDARRYEDAYNLYFHIIEELKKSPDFNIDFLEGGAWRFRASGSKGFELHILFKEIARNIKFHQKSFNDYPFIDPKYHAQILKIRVRKPKLKKVKPRPLVGEIRIRIRDL